MAKIVKLAPPPPPEIEVFEDIEQGTREWHDIRLGIPTASMFKAILASGKNGDESKTRSLYMRKLAGEIMTGEPAENYKSAAMQRGNDMEAEARFHYARTNFVELRRVGFVRRKLKSGSYVGCSPDSLIGANGGLEIKTMMPDLMIEHAMRGTFPPEHRAQLHGTIWVAGLSWMDLVIFYRGMPISPRYRVERDEKTIQEISNAVEVFEYELRKLVERVRAMGR